MHFKIPFESIYICIHIQVQIYHYLAITSIFQGGRWKSLFGLNLHWSSSVVGMVCMVITKALSYHAMCDPMNVHVPVICCFHIDLRRIQKLSHSPLTKDTGSQEGDNRRNQAFNLLSRNGNWLLERCCPLYTNLGPHLVDATGPSLVFES